MNGKTESFYEFAGFRLDVAKRILIRQGEPVALAPKVFDTLLFLVQNSGRILEKDELMRSLWPDSFVEEGNLSQNIFVLRKILGNDQNGN
jgi:DNA-binding winged helix-turn-helix (wHTH) protein